MVRQLVFVYKVSDTRYQIPFYLLKMERVQKLYKIQLLCKGLNFVSSLRF